jgi:3-oxoacid CoA-transferase subunit B
MGGAMDLVSGARRVVVVMEHLTRSGEPRLLEDCTLPLTGRLVVQRVVTDLAVLDVADGSFRLVDTAPGVTEAELEAATAAPICS